MEITKGDKWRQEQLRAGQNGDHKGRQMKQARKETMQGDKWRETRWQRQDFGDQQPNLWEVRTPIASSYLGNKFTNIIDIDIDCWYWYVNDDMTSTCFLTDVNSAFLWTSSPWLHFSVCRLQAFFFVLHLSCCLHCHIAKVAKAKKSWKKKGEQIFTDSTTR